MSPCSKCKGLGAVSSDSALGLDSRFRLTMRTSMLSEYRNAEGGLGAIEFSHEFTSMGALRNALARIPGVEFELNGDSVWASGRTPFKFKDRLYEISVPHQDVRIAPVERGAAYRETDELLRLLMQNLLPKWQNRARARFYRS
jgi:hypothetical protein